MKRHSLRTITAYIWAFLALSPLVWLAYTSVRLPNSPIFTFTLVNFQSLFYEEGLQQYLLNSVVVTFSVSVISLVMASLAGYALARGVTWSRHLGVLVLTLQLLPPIALAFPMFVLLQRFQLLDTRIGLTLALLALALPFAIWTLRQFFVRTSPAPEEAALIDGASRWQVLLHITLPIARPGLATALIFVIIKTWNEFLFGLTLTVSQAEPATVLAANFVTVYDVLWGKVSAIGLILIIPPTLTTVLLRRYVVKGITGDEGSQ
jgi:multiple sugar transport system permease protein